MQPPAPGCRQASELFDDLGRDHDHRRKAWCSIRTGRAPCQRCGEAGHRSSKAGGRTPGPAQHGRAGQRHRLHVAEVDQVEWRLRVTSTSLRRSLRQTFPARESISLVLPVAIDASVRSSRASPPSSSRTTRTRSRQPDRPACVHDAARADIRGVALQLQLDAERRFPRHDEVRLDRRIVTKELQQGHAEVRRAGAGDPDHESPGGLIALTRRRDAGGRVACRPSQRWKPHDGRRRERQHRETGVAGGTVPARRRSACRTGWWSSSARCCCSASWCLVSGSRTSGSSARCSA